ncbi:hypothetical protein, partial [Yersinia enterocolitica]
FIVGVVYVFPFFAENSFKDVIFCHEMRPPAAYVLALQYFHLRPISPGKMTNSRATLPGLHLNIVRNKC